MNPCGRLPSVSRWAASTSESNRQQKHPPGISSVAKCCERSIAVSTRLRPWSLVMMPTRSPCSVSRAASRPTAVVLPAPRNPPIMINRAVPGPTAALPLGLGAVIGASKMCICAIMHMYRHKANQFCEPAVNLLWQLVEPERAAAQFQHILIGSQLVLQARDHGVEPLLPLLHHFNQPRLLQDPQVLRYVVLGDLQPFRDLIHPQLLLEQQPHHAHAVQLTQRLQRRNAIDSSHCGDDTPPPAPGKPL